MKNFSKIEEQQLITKIWKVHDEIFSLPAKRYVFAIIDQNIGGAVLFAYDCLEQIQDSKVIPIRQWHDFHKFKFEFGDRLIIVYCETGLNVKNDFIFKRGPINRNYPHHNSIIITLNFFNQNEFASLYRETIMEYKYKNHQNFPKISGIYSFEYMIQQMKENKK